MQEITNERSRGFDDILIYGCGDTIKEALKNHNYNLENLLKRLKC